MFSDTAELLEFIRVNNHSEGRSYEYKRGLPWNSNDDFKYKIIKAVLSMSNLPDGGYIIIGVEIVNKRYEPVGFEYENAMTYDREKILEASNAFADPYVDLDLKYFSLYQT